MKKNILIIGGVIVLALGIWVLVERSKDRAKITEEVVVEEEAPTVDSPEWKTVERDQYIFEAPQDWNVSTLQDANGCSLDGIANDTSDGHRMAGEIGIYEASCFDLENAPGRREVEEKQGYYIIAFYDPESGTTSEEEEETKLVFKRVTDSFRLK